MIFVLAKSCSNGKIFTECASTCPLTCINKNVNSEHKCSLNCRPECICPYGMFIDYGKNGTCVQENECSCYYQDSYYKQDQIVQVDCNKW